MTTGWPARGTGIILGSQSWNRFPSCISRPGSSCFVQALESCESTGVASWALTVTAWWWDLLFWWRSKLTRAFFQLLNPFEKNASAAFLDSVLFFILFDVFTQWQQRIPFPVGLQWSHGYCLYQLSWTWRTLFDSFWTAKLLRSGWFGLTPMYRISPVLHSSSMSPLSLLLTHCCCLQLYQLPVCHCMQLATLYQLLQKIIHLYTD